MKLKRFLWILSGDDYEIISRCDRRLQRRFALIGLFVLAIFALCFASSYFTFTMLFQNYTVGVLVALFFAWMITNIYLLLLYTLSKNVLPHCMGKKTTFASIGLRILFICFIAIVVSKPLEILLFSAPLERKIEQFKEGQIERNTTITSEYFENEINQLKSLITGQKKLSSNFDAKRVDRYELLLRAKEMERRELIFKTHNLVRQSNYYVKSILILNNEYPICWFFTVLIVSIFLIPANLKHFIAVGSQYYNAKMLVEVELVRSEYEHFKTKYNRLLRDNFGADKNFIELYADAPFNTILKVEETNFLPEQILLAELYDA